MSTCWVRTRLLPVVTAGALLAACASDSTAARSVSTTTTTPIPAVTDGHALGVAPHRGLADGDVVTVSGSGIATSNGTAAAVQCRAGATPRTYSQDCDPATNEPSRDSLSGQNPSTRRFAPATIHRLPFTVRRDLELSGQRVDCAVAPGCVLLALADSPDVYGVTPIRFDRSRPRKPPTRLVIRPRATGLRDGERITVRVSHAYPNAPVDGITLCRIDGPECAQPIDLDRWEDPPAHVRTDGTWSYRGIARAVEFTSAGLDYRYRTFDCTTPPGCRITVQLRGERLSKRIGFVAGTRRNGTPRLDLEPSGTALSDGQTVTVRAVDLPVRLHLDIAVCVPASELPDGSALPGTVLCGDDGGTIDIGGNGTGTARFAVHRLQPPYPGAAPVDCSIADRCVVAIHQGFGLAPGSAVIVSTPIQVEP